MELEYIKREMIRCYEIEKRKQFPYYKVSKRLLSHFTKPAEVYQTLVSKASDIELLIRAAFMVEWWSKVKGEWVSSSTPYPRQLSNTQKYAAVFTKLYQTPDSGSGKATILKNIVKAKLLLKGVSTEDYWSVLDYFLEKDLVSKFYVCVVTEYMQKLERESVLDDKKLTLLRQLQKAKQELIQKNYYSDVVQMVRLK